MEGSLFSPSLLGDSDMFCSKKMKLQKRAGLLHIRQRDDGKTRGVYKIWLGVSSSLRMYRLAATCAHFEAKKRTKDREVLRGAQNVRNL